jgi:hypothetical protein
MGIMTKQRKDPVNRVRSLGLKFPVGRTDDIKGYLTSNMQMKGSKHV